MLPTPKQIQEVTDIFNKNNNYKLFEYRRLRELEYLKLNQNELRYNDLINGTNTWIEAIQEIKEKYPKPKELLNV